MTIATWRLICVGTALVAPTTLAAQGSGIRRLQPADAIATSTFTRITGVRELQTGAVLVVDAADTTLSLVDLSNQSIKRIGRTGHGPREYDVLGSLWALRGDSTLVPDAGNRRWLIVHGSSIVETVPADAAPLRAVGALISGADSQGHVLGQRRVGSREQQGKLTVESLAVLRVQRSGGSVDTVARLRWRPYMLPPNSAGAARNPLVAQAFGLPLTAPEQSLLFHDRWIAIARLAPYRVDWISPDGQWHRGNPIPNAVVRVSAAEKQAYVDWIFRTSGRRVRVDAISNWPAEIDPFGEEALRAAPDGRLLVARTPTAAESRQRYDLVDRTGQVTGVLILDAGERIVGFGARSVFVVAADSDGVERLRRHPWP